MKKKVMKESTAWQIGAHTVMIIGSLLAILPFILLVIASFTGQPDRFGERLFLYSGKMEPGGLSVHCQRMGDYRKSVPYDDSGNGHRYGFKPCHYQHLCLRREQRQIAGS